MHTLGPAAFSTKFQVGVKEKQASEALLFLDT